MTTSMRMTRGDHGDSLRKRYKRHSEFHSAASNDSKHKLASVEARAIVSTE